MDYLDGKQPDLSPTMAENYLEDKLTPVKYQMSKHILFLTTANLATNPRLVKEVRTALINNFNVSVITFILGNWSDEKSAELALELESMGHLEMIKLNATKANQFQWLFWGGMEKTARLLYNFERKNLRLNALANTRRALQLFQEAKKINQMPDLICGHNLGALYPAYLLSKRWKCPFIFDVEDYHPGEAITTDAVNEKQRREYLMKKLLPKAESITSASTLIGEYMLKVIGGHDHHVTILNAFSQGEFEKPEKPKTLRKEDRLTLKLVWFSQKISAGRGLEKLFEALLQLKSGETGENIELTLIGNIDLNFETISIAPFMEGIKNTGIILQLLPPLTQFDLHQELYNFDVGLALEPGKDFNNELALSNKIMAYAQAGLFILATDTKAQKKFVEKYSGLGILSGQKVENIKTSLEILLRQSTEINENKLGRFNKAKDLSWEKEAEKLEKLWNRILKECKRK